MKIELFIEHIAKNVVTAVSEMYPDVEVVIVDPSGKLIGTTEKYNQAKNNRAYTPYIEEPVSYTHLTLPTILLV